MNSTIFLFIATLLCWGPTWYVIKFQLGIVDPMVSVFYRFFLASLIILLAEYVDLIVPRGGKGLIQRVAAESQIAILKHLDGICHVYIDKDADSEKAHRIAINAKTQRYGTCNTMETLLVAKAQVGLLPRLVAALQEQGVEVRGCAGQQTTIGVQQKLHCATISRPVCATGPSGKIIPSVNSNDSVPLSEMRSCPVLVL